jgi:hypothetical protein
MALANARACMSQVAMSRICVSTASTPSTIIHVRNACTEVSRLLACPAYRRAVRGFSRLDSPAPEDEDNIVAALKQSDRISSISLTVTNCLLEKLSAIDRPFPELEDLVIFSRDRMLLTLPRAFGWGQRLRSLNLTGIAFSHSLNFFILLAIL